MTAAEAYELTTQGGATYFARVVAVCERAGAWCLIGGLAERLNAQGAGSDLRIQFTTDARYQTFPERANFGLVAILSADLVSARRMNWILIRLPGKSRERVTRPRVIECTNCRWLPFREWGGLTLVTRKTVDFRWLGVAVLDPWRG